MHAKCYPIVRRQSFVEIPNDEWLRLFHLIHRDRRKQLLDLLPPPKVKGFRPHTDEAIVSQLKEWKKRLQSSNESEASFAWRRAGSLFVTWVENVPPAAPDLPTLNDLLLQFDNSEDFKNKDDRGDPLRKENTSLDVECFRYLHDKSLDDQIDQATVRDFYEIGYFARDARIEQLILACRPLEDIRYRKRHEVRLQTVETAIDEISSTLIDISELPKELRMLAAEQRERVTAIEQVVSGLAARAAESNSATAEGLRRIGKLEQKLEVLEGLVAEVKSAKDAQRWPRPPSHRSHPEVARCLLPSYPNEDSLLGQIAHSFERRGFCSSPDDARCVYVIANSFPLIIAGGSGTAAALAEAISGDQPITAINVPGGWTSDEWLTTLPPRLTDLSHFLRFGNPTTNANADCPAVLHLVDFDRSLPEAYLVAALENLCRPELESVPALIIGKACEDDVRVRLTQSTVRLAFDLRPLLDHNEQPVEALSPLLHAPQGSIRSWLRARDTKWNDGLDKVLGIYEQELASANVAEVSRVKRRLKRALATSHGLITTDCIARALALGHVAPLIITATNSIDCVLRLFERLGICATSALIGQLESYWCERG